MPEAGAKPRARWTPPPWLNRLMTWMLRTPALERWVGHSTLLLTFTGRRSGQTHTTPLSYARDGADVIVVGHRSRTWWRNLQACPEVVLRLAGRDHCGSARVVASDTPAALGRLDTYLAQQRITARAEGIGRDGAGRFRSEDLRRILDASVVVAIHLHEPATVGS